ncbi:MAG: phage tail tape measure protein [Rhizobiaceae bacterium]|nr:phage tail tape measure protein [Rhizobiaceae bacterium]
MAALDVDLVLKLVDKASGPAQGIMARMFGGRNGPAALTGQFGAAEGAMMALRRSAATFAAGAGAYFGFQALTGSAADFQSQLTAIQKKAGTTAEETRKIGQDALALANSGELATSIEEVLSAYERGAAAGIPLDELTEFAKLSAMAADAFEMSSEDVGNAAAGFKVALGIQMSEMEAYFGLINKLADAGIANESDLISFLDRAGANMKLFGLSAEQAAAYAASLANIKMAPETGARMMNTLTSKLLSPGSKAAQAALKGIVGNVGEFQKLLKSDANAALELFLKKVGELDKFKSAKLLTDFMGQGFADEVIRMSAAYDELQRNQKIAADRSSWENSLPETYKLKLDDFWSQWQLLKNALEALQIQLGDMGLPGLTSGLGSATELVKEIGEGLESFRAQIDTEELQAASATVGELVSKLETLLGMGGGDNVPIIAFFERLADLTNAISAGVVEARKTAEKFGLIEAEAEAPQQAADRKAMIADGTVSAAAIIHEGFGRFVEDYIARNADGQAAKTDRPTYLDATGRPENDPQRPVGGEPRRSRFGYDAPEPPEGQQRVIAAEATSWPTAPATADVEAYMAALGQAQQAKMKVAEPIVTSADLQTAAFMAGLATMESAARDTVARINATLGSISAPSVSGGGQVGSALRSHLGDGAN